ncbi:MAG: Na+/H+ antiporter NhaA [Bacteroidota bacterium]|nr:Na+/H+ antiporter NhaA [Bacteroidota bacterium]
MRNESIKKVTVEKWIIDPIQRFISNSATSGIILFSAAIVAMIISNSPWSEAFHHFWETEFGFGFNGGYLTKSLHHWINDGLMAVFFFVVGLELKREIIAGELNEIRKAILPVAGAIGGMVVPALIYLAFNNSGDAADGWGIPMATDIAFALGVVYLLGDKVPLALKIFLTALAIADDIGAVLVIAFFYTSSIDLTSLISGGIFLVILVVANLIGVRNTLFYAIVGIGGLWLAFLLSGVHATIAAVLAAFTIPANVKISEAGFIANIENLIAKFKKADPNNVPTVTPEQHDILQEIRDISREALTPLQRLEHTFHPLVAFIIMPIFALSNAGIVLPDNLVEVLMSPVTIGVFLGLIVGKVVGVAGMVFWFTRMKWAQLPPGVNNRHILGASFLAGVGFTMSLFISGLAFENEVLMLQAKFGILLASLLASIIGFLLLKNADR